MSAEGPTISGASNAAWGCDPLVLVLGADGHFAIPLAVTLCSLLDHLEYPDPVWIFLIDGGLSAIARRKIERVVQRGPDNVHLRWIDADQRRLRGLRAFGHVSTATYFSLVIPEVLPDWVEKAIYLDCDLLVEANVARLWREDLAEWALLAVQDFLVPHLGSPGGPAGALDLRLDLQAPYFNAGVLVINIGKWRARDVASQAIRYLHRYNERLTFRDQEALNAALAGDWRMLDPRWNAATAILWFDRWPASAHKERVRAQLEGLLACPFITHFTGANKPWHAACEHPSRLGWQWYLRKTGWFDPAKPAAGTRSAPARFANRPVEHAPPALVTVAIPTRDRAHCLKQAIASVLAQDFTDVKLLVLDDASSDATPQAVRAFSDPRITYLRNDDPLGLAGNLGRALELSDGRYVTVLPDDDRLLPGSIAASVGALEAHPSAAMSTGPARLVDHDGEPLATPTVVGLTPGLMEGRAFLHRLIAAPSWQIHSATVMLRRSSMRQIGPVKVRHAWQNVDLDLYARLAERFDVVVLDQALAEVRLRDDQQRSVELRAHDGLWPLAALAVRIDALAYLLRSGGPATFSAPDNLAAQLLALNAQYSALLRAFVPSLDRAWRDRQSLDAARLADLVPAGMAIVLVDEALWLAEEIASCMVLPFLERDGQRNGDPADDAEAIRELERMRQDGADFIVFPQHASWWFEHYRDFYVHLCRNYGSPVSNESFIAFDLRSVTGPVARKRRIQAAPATGEEVTRVR